MSLNIPNLDKLIAHLEAQPPETFNMGETTFEGCGTAACIGGHLCVLFEMDWTEAVEVLGDGPEFNLLFCPPGWTEEGNAERQRYPLLRAIATLKRLRDRFLETGEIIVDWGPEPTAGEIWSAPRAVEITPPALPETLTRLLAAQPAPTATEAVRG